MKPKFQIDQRMFYKIAIAAFGIMATMNTATLLQTYQVLLMTQIVSQIGGILFNYALLGFFIYLFKGLPPKDTKMASDKEFEDMIRDSSVILHKKEGGKKK